MKRVALLVSFLAALVGATGLLAAGIAGISPGRADDLVVHEWGTFTSVAGPAGQAIDWQPLSGPQDLPCFVTNLNPTSFKVAPSGWLPTVSAKVRMETPVLYFYTPRAQQVDVRVHFPQGLITEWYPRAAVPSPTLPLNLSTAAGSIEWKDVSVEPGGKAAFAIEARNSHYYATRDTDAVPLQVGNQHEKFLFYRGLASFPVPVSARISDGEVAVDRTGTEMPVMLFENRGGRIGYRVEKSLSGQVVMERPVLRDTFESLRRDLEARLTAQGLYPREAKAMVETWQDSWFEEGTRLFYFLPQSSVDAILPLEIAPRPNRVSRVFVGRLEIITPETEDEVEQALRNDDLDTLNKYGRFLEPIARSVLARPSLAVDRAQVRAALQAVASAHTAPAACR
jgi:hypothetical protein